MNKEIKVGSKIIWVTHKDRYVVTGEVTKLIGIEKAEITYDETPRPGQPYFKPVIQVVDIKELKIDQEHYFRCKVDCEYYEKCKANYECECSDKNCDCDLAVRGTHFCAHSWKQMGCAGVVEDVLDGKAVI